MASTLTVPQNVGPVSRSIVDTITAEGAQRSIPVDVQVSYSLNQRQLTVTVDRFPALAGEKFQRVFPLADFTAGITPEIRAELFEVFR